jgi:hypothetical protein
MRKQQNIFIRNPEGKRSLGISVSKWKNSKRNIEKEHSLGL